MARLLSWALAMTISLGLAYAVATVTANAVSESFNQSAALINGAGR